MHACCLIHVCCSRGSLGLSLGKLACRQLPVLAVHPGVAPAACMACRGDATSSTAAKLGPCSFLLLELVPEPLDQADVMTSGLPAIAAATALTVASSTAAGAAEPLIAVGVEGPAAAPAGAATAPANSRHNTHPLAAAQCAQLIASSRCAQSILSILGTCWDLRRADCSQQQALMFANHAAVCCPCGRSRACAQAG
jgi:hypothetical protein